MFFNYRVQKKYDYVRNVYSFLNFLIQIQYEFLVSAKCTLF